MAARRLRSPYRLVLGSAWRADRTLTAVLGVCVSGTVLLTGAVVVVTGALVSSVPDAVRDGAGSDAAGHLYFLVVVLAGVLFVQQTLVGGQDLATRRLGRRVEGHLRDGVMTSTLAPATVAHLRDPESLADIAAATTVGTARFGPSVAVVALPPMLQSLGTGVVLAVLITYYLWWAGPVLLGVWLLARHVRQRDVLAGMRFQGADETGTRRQGYFRDLALQPAAAKEVRIFGLSSWIVDTFRTEWLATMQVAWAQRRAERRSIAVPLTLLAIANLAALYALARGVESDTLGLKGLSIALQVIIGMAVISDPGGVTVFDMMLVEGARPIERAHNLRHRLTTSSRTAAHPSSVLSGVAANRSVVFDHVCFRYPGTESDVLTDLNLTLRAGESLALVGDNGAGKTTVVRLLCGFLVPDKGRILVDGVAIDALDQAEWLERLAVIFQDFTRFDGTLAENVSLSHLGTQPSGDDLERVAADAGIGALVATLPDGWDTELTRGIAGATNLSAGQWQRVALARALFALRSGSDVLVMDEPTANLDVRAEADFYERFLELTRGSTSLLISHRYATIRRATTIAVLSEGHIVESGNHDSLMAADGRYAALFRLQADPTRWSAP